jgi:hypothetical protein
MLAPRARRAASYLLTPGLAVLLAAACTAGAPMGGDGPVNPDADGNGVLDALQSGKCIIDTNGDGRPDPVDLDGDGTLEGPGFDSDCDQTADGFGIDSNNDGIIDTIENDDGTTVTPPAGSGGGGNTIDVDGVAPTGGTTGETEYCSEAEVEFVPQIPTVLVLVDRSSSMFVGAVETQFWTTLKAAVLPVIEGLQADVRFGFASYTGSVASCTGLSSPTPFAVDNYAVIESAYNALAAPSEKGETPTAKAIEQGTELLLADDSPGDRYILLVTDGDPDFCDDPPKECGADALVASLQLAAAQGVRTLVFGIDNPDISNPLLFDYYAQAGMGQLPDWELGLQAETEGQYSGDLEGACKNTGGGEWARYRTANGNDPLPAPDCPHDYMDVPPYACFLPAGNYGAEGGTATAFLSTDIAGLAEQINSTVSGLKSCIFDLGDSGVSVKEGEEDTGEIFVQDELIPQDQWRMNSATVLELLGDSCTKWQSPEVTKFFAGFPCEALIIVVK